MLLPFAYSLLQRRDAVVVLLSTTLSFTVILINLTDSLLSNKRHAAIFVMMFAIIISISSATRSDELALERVDDHN
jgi:NADH:ubiquinone oxidoreductase subunit K